MWVNAFFMFSKSGWMLSSLQQTAKCRLLVYEFFSLVISIHIYICMCMYVRIHMHVYVCTCMYMYAYTYICRYVLVITVA